MADDERIRAAIAGADRHLNAWHGSPRPRERMAVIAEATGADERMDTYGSGERIERLETRVAELLGKEAAVFMPTGTMAQPIALRVWSTDVGSRRLLSIRPVISSCTRSAHTSASTAFARGSSETRTA